jgi:hypothetical protein
MVNQSWGSHCSSGNSCDTDRCASICEEHLGTADVQLLPVALIRFQGKEDRAERRGKPPAPERRDAVCNRMKEWGGRGEPQLEKPQSHTSLRGDPATWPLSSPGTFLTMETPNQSVHQWKNKNKSPSSSTVFFTRKGCVSRLSVGIWNCLLPNPAYTMFFFYSPMQTYLWQSIIYKLGIVWI